MLIPLEERGGINYKSSWLATTSLYGNWTNKGSIYGCQTWTPDASTVRAGESFTQTSNDCSQDQTRTVTLRERNPVTGEIRTSGSSIENQTITATSTRTTVGIKDVNCVYQTSAPRSVITMGGHSSDSVRYYDYILYYDGKQISSFSTTSDSYYKSYKVVSGGKTFYFGTQKTYVYQTFPSATYEICYE